MLRRLTIRRFKSIYQSTLKFGRANLFIGVNGTGKSNVLEALGVLSAALSKGLEGNTLDTKGVRFSRPHLFKSSFRNTNVLPSFRLEAVFEHGRYLCSIRSGLTRSSLEFHSEELFDGSVKVFGRGPNGNTVNSKIVEIPIADLRRVPANQGFWQTLGTFANISPQFRRELEGFSDFAIYAPQTAIMRGIANDPKVVEPLGLTGSNLPLAFREALTFRRQVSREDKIFFDKIMSVIWAPGWADQVSAKPFDPNIVPAQVSSGGLLLYIRDKFMKTNKNMLSTFDASEGALYLVFVATLLLHPRAPNTFALDNVDGTLNARLVRILTDTLVEACVNRSAASEIQAYQTFVTSHHPSSLDSFDIFSEHQKIFVSRRREEGVVGSTYFEPLIAPEGTTKPDWVRQSQGRNLSELLLEGLIPGGL